MSKICASRRPIGDHRSPATPRRERHGEPLPCSAVCGGSGLTAFADDNRSSRRSLGCGPLRAVPALVFELSRTSLIRSSRLAEPLRPIPVAFVCFGVPGGPGKALQRGSSGEADDGIEWCSISWHMCGQEGLTSSGPLFSCLGRAAVADRVSFPFSAVFGRFFVSGPGKPRPRPPRSLTSRSMAIDISQSGKAVVCRCPRRKGRLSVAAATLPLAHACGNRAFETRREVPPPIGGEVRPGASKSCRSTTDDLARVKPSIRHILSLAIDEAVGRSISMPIPGDVFEKSTLVRWSHSHARGF